MKTRLSALAFTLATLIAPAANAALVTIGKDQGPIIDACYPGAPGCSFDSWDMIQNGFTAQTSTAYFDSNAFLYLHDDGGITESVFASVDGYHFDAVMANARAYSNVYQTAADPRPTGAFGDPDFDIWATGTQPAYGNVGWFGYRDGAEVAQMVYHQDGDYSDLAFGTDFVDLDRLVLRSLIPAGVIDYVLGDDTLLGVPGANWCAEWCAGVKLATLTLNVRAAAPSAVPLPAGFGPLALALMLLGLLAAAKGRKGRAPAPLRRPAA